MGSFLVGGGGGLDVFGRIDRIGVDLGWFLEM